MKISKSFVGMEKKGYGQYSIIIKKKNGKTVSVHSTDSELYDAIYNEDDEKKMYNATVMASNRAKRELGLI